MADIKQPPTDALKFRIGDVATTRAECDRFLSATKSPSGRFAAQAHVSIVATPGSSDSFQVSLVRSVTGRPKESEEPVAFFATCTVSCVVEFDRNISLDAIPDNIARQIALSLFHVATERCRTMVTWMGFPAGPSISMMPRLDILKTEPETPSTSPSAKPVQKTRKRKAPSKKTAKSSLD